VGDCTNLALQIASDRDLETEFAAFVKPFEGKETEHNWLERERAIARVRGMIKGEAHIRFEESFINALLHGFIASSFKTVSCFLLIFLCTRISYHQLASLRTTLASNTCYLYSELAVAIGNALDPAAEQLFANLLFMAGFTKKIIAQQSQATVDTLVSHMSPLPRTIIPHFTRTLAEKNPQARAFLSGHVKHYLDVHAARHRSMLESGGYVDALDNLVKKGLVDSNIVVREPARITFWSYHAVWPARAAVILNGLDTVGRKGVEKACPNPDAAPALLTATAASTATTKKSSVAAAIAASRAKARAIANAPPTLIHQATSTSHMQASSKVSSPPVQRPASPVSRIPASPPRVARVASSSFRPTSSNVAATPPRARTPTSHTPPVSPRTLEPSKKMRPSPGTPEKERSSSISIRRAIVTPLPASPPPPATLVTPPTPRAPINPRTGNARVSIASVLGDMNTHARASMVMPDMEGDNESLLLASTIPIPEDDSSMDVDEMDQDIDTTFTAAPLRISTSSRPIAKSNSNSLSNASNSQAFSFSPKSDMSFLPPQSNSLSSKSSALGSSGPVVEDALRARAEQAESAAERLLELVDTDEDNMFSTPAPFSTNGYHRNGASSNGSPTSPRHQSGGVSQMKLPVTPVANRAAVLRRAAQFQDTPNDRKGPSMMDTLRDHQDQSGWWLKRMKRMR
jgi:CLIP-associating protein 1/2